MRTALIVGVSGQDGILLAQHLTEVGYRIVGTTRGLDNQPNNRLSAAGLLDRIQLTTLDPCDFKAVAGLVRDVRPDEIYNLAGQSSVGASFQVPLDTVESVIRGTLSLLEAIRANAPEARFFNTGSSECFGNTPIPATESTAFSPRSPYGAAKAAGVHLVSVYRASYGLFACSGIVFNHESPLRPVRFVTRKVAAFVADVVRGRATQRLKVGDLTIRRDWGWAPEYIQAFHRMLLASDPHDLILATGHSASLEEYISASFSCMGLRAEDYVESDPTLFRPSEIQTSAGNPAAASALIGWRAKTLMPEIASALVRHELDRQA